MMQFADGKEMLTTMRKLNDERRHQEGQDREQYSRNEGRNQ